MHVRLDAGDLMLRHTGYHAENPTDEYAQTTPGEGTKKPGSELPGRIKAVEWLLGVEVDSVARGRRHDIWSGVYVSQHRSIGICLFCL